MGNFWGKKERMILGKRVIFTNLKTNFELGCRSINWCRSMIIVGWIFGEKGDFLGKGDFRERVILGGVKLEKGDFGGKGVFFELLKLFKLVLMNCRIVIFGTVFWGKG